MPFREIWSTGLFVIFLLQFEGISAQRALLAGSLTWEVNPLFLTRASNRTVTFTMLTAFQQSTSCVYNVGQPTDCPLHGSLCVNQYSVVGDRNALPSFSDVQTPSVKVPRLTGVSGTPGSCIDSDANGFSNQFTVISTQTINGLDVVFGKLVVTVLVNPAAGAVIAYFATRTNAAGVGILGNAQGVLLQDCTLDSTLPCGVNIFDPSMNYGLRRDRSTGILSEIFEPQYWGVPSLDPWQTIRLRSPALETIVPLCSTQNAANTSFDCANGPDWLKNYYSPVPVFPAFVEVAVTPTSQRQECTSSQFIAPHVPMYFKSYDYDGHRMTQYDPYARKPQSAGSTRSAKCFTPQAGGRPSAMGASAGAFDRNTFDDSWPFGSCMAFFDGDKNANRSSGNLIKFDFDFGLSPNCPRSGSATLQQAQFSSLFGNLSACTPAASCPASKTFSQHVIHTADFPYVDVDQGTFYDPDTSNGDDHLRWFSLFPNLDSASLSAKGAMVQTVFAAYPCWSGYANTPPSFVPSLDDAPDSCRLVPAYTAQDQAAVQTEYSCTAGQLCKIPLHVRDLAVDATGQPAQPSSADCSPGKALLANNPLQVELASGWDAAADFSLDAAYCSLNPALPCVRDSTCAAQGAGECTGTAAGGGLSAACASPASGARGELKCMYQQNFTLADAGRFVVRCFTAREQFATQTNQNRSCRSAPLCIKIRVVGRPPAFVSPTPLAEDAYAADGTAVTEVGACEGTTLTIPIAAVDPDVGDLVRLYVYDEDADAAGIGAGGGGTSFFGPDSENSTGAVCTGNVPFRGYGAGRVGIPKLPASIVPVLAGTGAATADGRIAPGGVATAYAAGITYAAVANATVAYNLNLTGVTVGNGIMLLPQSVCQRGQAAASPLTSRCGETLLNVDRTVCAYAYDNSRGRTRRWVGERNPNGAAGAAGARVPSHGDGDLVAKHCWRVRLQAPPVFVTDPAGVATPFAAAGGDAACAPGSIPAGAAGSVYCLRVYVGQLVRKTFVAQDPNPGDAVTIFLVEDPALGGPPAGLSVGRTVCIPRVINQTVNGTLAEGMCSPSDLSGVPSTCSKAMLTVEWRPAAEHAGRTYFVCARARDSSALCAGAAEGATALGWYGEQHCVGLQVSLPQIGWAADSDVLGEETEQLAYVGCRAQFTVAAAARGADTAAITAVGDLPPGATLRATAGGGGDAGAVAAVFAWEPARGTEGFRFRTCFTVAYTTAADGGGGGAGWDQVGCRVMAVQRCRYCVADGSTLAGVSKEYAHDTNWLRLWLHNAAVMDSPDLLPRANSGASAEPTTQDAYENALGATVLNIGLLYQTRAGDSLAVLAGRFRTTARGLLAVNPDVAAAGKLLAGQELCVVPCSQQDVLAQ